MKAHARPPFTPAIATLVVALVVLPSLARAGLRAQCRKACKPLVAACVEATGQSRRVCKKPILRNCRLEGLQVCDVGSTVTTTTLPSKPHTTSTTLPDVPGYLRLEAEDIDRDASTDPGAYGLLITVSGVDGNLPVALDTSAFYVLDANDVRYEAHPAVAPEDCSADDVVDTDGSVTCRVHFTLPLVVGYDSTAGGQGYAALFVEVGGYRRVLQFRVRADGGWGTIS